VDLDSFAPNLAASYRAAAHLVATMKAANGVKMVDLIAGKQHNDSMTAGSIVLSSGIAAPRAAARPSRPFS
jgi:hypothetical protein